jgi:hypothetical protein
VCASACLYVCVVRVYVQVYAIGCIFLTRTSLQDARTIVCWACVKEWDGRECMMANLESILVNVYIAVFIMQTGSFCSNWGC